MGIKFDLLKEAYAIIDGIPDHQFDLDRWIQEESKQLGKCNIDGCGTIACAGGWLAQHPKFNELGLRMTWNRGFGRGENSRDLQYKKTHVRGFNALGKVFGMGYTDVRNLFSASGVGLYDHQIKNRLGHGLSHKTLFKYRVKHFLNDYDPAYSKLIYN